MARKSIDVGTVIGWVNTVLSVESPLRGTTDLTPDQAFRYGVSSILELILHETGNYRGFGYLDSPYVRGVTDETRRRYDAHPRLKVSPPRDSARPATTDARGLRLVSVSSEIRYPIGQPHLWPWPVDAYTRPSPEC